jgi:hypothetical protein
MDAGAYRQQGSAIAMKVISTRTIRHRRIAVGIFDGMVESVYPTLESG